MTEPDWKQMIERYNQELMAQYAVAKPTAESIPGQEEIPSETPESVSKSDASSEEHPLDDIGYLQVRITTENQAIPIVGAVVTVTHDFGEGTILDIIETTDQNGQTSIIPLATKSRQLSLQPGVASPFAAYTVEVVADGYFTKRFEKLPIYGGVTAFQNVSMIPLPEAGDPNESISYPPPSSVLS